MFKAVIFDMDGLLIDSEPFWEEAEVEAFNRVGVPLTIARTKETMGLRVDEVVEYWYSKYPWQKPSKRQVEAEIVKKVIELINKKGQAREGAVEIIKFIKKQNIPIAIASSSLIEIMDAVIDKLGIRDYVQVICSAEHERFGKPHPGIYLTATRKLGLKPKDCLVFEDSPNGVVAAKAAKMKCVAVPSEKVKGDPHFKLADEQISSLRNFREINLF